MSRWRYVCPRGHTSWHGTTQGHYRCDRCLENGDTHRFDELIDRKNESLEY